MHQPVDQRRRTFWLGVAGRRHQAAGWPGLMVAYHCCERVGREVVIPPTRGRAKHSWAVRPRPLCGRSIEGSSLPRTGGASGDQKSLEKTQETRWGRDLVAIAVCQWDGCGFTLSRHKRSGWLLHLRLVQISVRLDDLPLSAVTGNPSLACRAFLAIMPLIWVMYLSLRLTHRWMPPLATSTLWNSM